MLRVKVLLYYRYSVLPCCINVTYYVVGSLLGLLIALCYCYVSYTMDTVAHSPGVKRQGREFEQSPPSSAEVKNRGTLCRLPHTSPRIGAGRTNLHVFLYIFQFLPFIFLAFFVQ
jgi:hypothetical protein